MKLLLIAFFIFSFQSIIGQEYHTIDSIVNTYPKKFKSIEGFADRILLDFKTDLDKTRAAYYWIANNISYDYTLARKKSKNYKINSKSNSDYDAKLYKLKRKYAAKTLRKKIAICEGYSQLLTEVLKDLNIISVVVSGYAKRFSNEIGKNRSSSNHAWNAVRIEEKWYLIDVTWSTGNSMYNDKFVDFSDTYFLISPDELIRSHFPNDKQWQLLKKPISKIVYFDFPIYYPAYHNSGLKLQNNFSGNIITKTDSIIQLNFTKIDESKTYYYSFEKGVSGRINFKIENGSYQVEIPYTEKRRKNLVISDGQLALIKFKIRLAKKQ